MIMNKQEAIEYIQEWLKDEYALNGKDKVVLNIAIEALQDDWIPVSEKQPSQTGEYLATAEYYDGVIFTDKFGYTPTTDGGWYDPEEPNQTHIDWNKFIIAWKPLPEPYKESEE